LKKEWKDFFVQVVVQSFGKKLPKIFYERSRFTEPWLPLALPCLEILLWWCYFKALPACLYISKLTKGRGIESCQSGGILNKIERNKRNIGEAL
jgi:hypothetical protein